MFTKRNAIIGAATVAIGRMFLRRSAKSAAAGARRLPLLAGIGAGAGALFFWRRKRRRKRQTEFFES